MRRRQRTNDDPPLRLLRFDPDDWGGGPDAAVRWYAALDEWRDSGHKPFMHPPGTVWPDVPWDPSAS